MKRLAIFAGYGKNSVIEDYVIYYLQELNKVADIVFVYDNQFSEIEIKKVNDLTIHQICEHHGEYDFGSYKRGYQWAQSQGLLDNCNELILCNDSCFGPFKSFESIFDQMKKCDDIDFWGAFFESCNRFNVAKKSYIQSYFMVFSNKVFQSKCFNLFFESVKKENSKRDIIIKYEEGLTNCLLNNNFKCRGLFNSATNDPHNDKAIELIRNGFPFLKRSLFDVNSDAPGCRELFRYKDVIKKYSNYNIDYISNYINRIFSSEDLKFVLAFKFKVYEGVIIGRKGIRFSFQYIRDRRYKIIIRLFGIRIIKIILPERWSYKKGICDEKISC